MKKKNDGRFTYRDEEGKTHLKGFSPFGREEMLMAGLYPEEQSYLTRALDRLADLETMVEHGWEDATPDL